VTRGKPLAGRRALVTGAASGIGRATAERLAADGAAVLAADLRIAELDVPGVEVAVADMADPAAVAAAVDEASAGEGLDICVANAGIALLEDFVDGGVESWGQVLRTNLLGVMVTLQEAVKSMIGTGTRGRLLATSSIAGLHAERGGAAYCASKAGVIALVRTLSVELAPWGITVNAVAPGQIDTPMNVGDLEIVSRREGRPVAELRREHLEEHVPSGRLGTPDEVAALFAFLASDAAGFINGEVIRIDGGELA
jgi:NAD(P)-dependent dehydrogenase (short-subunit alcohol dehydrogenase family)